MTTRYRCKGSAFVWTRGGWERRPHESNVTLSTQACYQQAEFDPPVTRSDIDRITEAYNQIQVGSVGLEFDQLPGPTQQILYSPDVWHISTGGKLFRIVDPIEQARAYNEWGTDIEDQDEDQKMFEPTTSATRLFLEQSGMIDPECMSSQTADALCNVVAGGGYFDPAVNEDEHSIIPLTATGHQPLPLLPKDIEEEVKRITAQFLQQRERLLADNSKEKRKKTADNLETLALTYEQAVDALINPILTLPLNSPFCGRGHIPPKRKYLFIPTPRPSNIVAAAEERVNLFEELFGRASANSSMSDLFGPITKDARKTLPSAGGQVRNPNYGRPTRSGGFYGEIRGMHSSDKALATAWSIHPTYERKDGEIIESAFTIQRRKFIHEWREQQKGDEESLRIALWAWFDRTAGELKAVYDDKGDLIEKRRIFRDSIWRQKRTEALTELFMTKPQWDAVYTMLSMVKQRIARVPKRNFSGERTKILKKLRDLFPQIENLRDLNAYMAWAQKRQWNYIIRTSQSRTFKDGSSDPIMIGPHRNTYTFKPSMLDRISTIDEVNWRKSCAKKKKYLQNRYTFGRYLAKQVVTTNLTSLPDLAVACHDPKCDCMAIGSPLEAVFPDGNTAKFIRCEGTKERPCNQPVWLIDHREEYPHQDHILKSMRCAACDTRYPHDNKARREERCERCKLV